MRILQITMSSFADEPGGLNRMVAGLTHGLITRGHTVETAGCSDSRDPSLTYVIEGHRVGMWRRLVAARSVLRKATSPPGPDLVAVHFAPYARPALSSLSRLPLVAHFHGPWALEAVAEGSGSLAVAAKHRIERAVYRRADAVIVLSRAFADLLCARYGVDPSRVRLIPGGVDVDRFAVNEGVVDARKQLDWPTDRITLVAVRRLRKRMGLDRLIEACAAVRGMGIDFGLHIVGDGPEKDALQAAVRRLELESTVRFEGRIPDELLPLVYRAADFSVVPTTELEGFGLIAVESLAAGTPPIVTPVGGLPEIVRPLDPELVAADTTVDALAERLMLALTGRLVRPTSDRCRDFARHGFSWERISEQVEDVYAQVLQSTSPRRNASSA